MLVDKLIKNAKVFNVFVKEWKLVNIAIIDDKIYYVGQKENFKSKENIDLKGKRVIPGFIDIHLHIESSFCSPYQFAKAVSQKGVTTVVAEPHEIANIFGVEGVNQMIKASEQDFMDIFIGLPSSVPSTNSSLETTGGKIVASDGQLIGKDIICLGEVMQYRELLNNREELIKSEDSLIINLIKEVKETNPLVAIEGHCPYVVDEELATLLYFGIDSDHCLQTPLSLLQRFEQGMFVEIQSKSILPEIIEILKDEKYDGLYSFVTDDVPPNILKEKGHIDYLVNKAMKLGLSLEQCILATSYSPSKRIGFRDRGSVSAGKLADFIVLKDSENLEIEKVFKRGKELHNTLETKKHSFPKEFYDSITINENLSIDEMLCVKTNENINKCRVMQKSSDNTYTKEVFVELESKSKELDWQRKDLNLVLVVNRYNKENYAQGLLNGIYVKNGAFASSHAHDHHNILVMGDNKEDMILAYNKVLETNGGVVFASENTIKANIPLEVAGVISDNSLENISSEFIKLNNLLKASGIESENPIMTLTTITLPVSPDLKITDMGLIDVKSQKIVSLFV